MNIPGFYYDSRTNRFYRDSKGPWEHVKLDHNVTDTKVKQAGVSAMIAPKTKGILGLLRNRENGVRKNPNIEYPFLKLKTNLGAGAGTQDDLTVFDEDISDILMVKGGQRTLFGLWKSVDRQKEVVAEIISTSEIGLFIDARDKRVVRDFCTGLDESGLMLILNDYSIERCYILLVNRTREVDNSEEICVVGSASFSCCSNSFAKHFAIGSEHAVKVRGPYGDYYDTTTKGNVHSVHFNDVGTVLYCGIHTGSISTIDMRQKSTCAHVKLFKTGINDMVLLSNQQEVICASFDGYLCKFDLRMHKQSAIYLNHSCSTKKNPLSINESYNLLCATGLDNFTRLWSLNGGVPVRVIQPPEKDQFHKTWLTNDPWKATLYLFQKKNAYAWDV